MPDLRARELRNDLSRVLRRVQAGERLRVTLRGRPVADLVPVSSRPATMTGSAFWAALSTSRADAGLQDDLRQALPGDTDDVKIA
jgi:prevent-host-death family protein